jgi:hypothetical protein
MTYNDEAKALGIKILGVVESNQNYSAINYNDPITVGVVQWFGTRAASILVRMRDENPGAWYQVAPSLAGQLYQVPANNAFWNSRYLTYAEGESLKPVLSANQAIQNDQLIDDMEVYKAVAISYGFDPDSNTETVLYFFSMHHQAPAYALEVVQTLDTTATLAQIHAACLAHPVLGQYGVRYQTTHDLIVEGDLSGVEPPPPIPDDGITEVPHAGQITYVHSTSNRMFIQWKDGHRLECIPNGRDYWIPISDTTVTDPPPPPVDPPPPTTGAWTHPLPGSTLTSPFGPRAFDGLASFHYGIDLAHPAGSPGDVLAPTAMVITVAKPNGTGVWSAGEYVKGRTLDNAYTFNFYHLQAGSLNVSVGQTVPVGHKLGVEGATGNVSGQHLHFEAYAGTPADPWPPPYGNPIDPLPILRNNGVAI